MVGIMKKRYKVALCMNIGSYYEHGIVRGCIRFAKEQENWQLFGHGWTLGKLSDLNKWRGDGIVSIVKSEKDAAILLSTGLPVVDVAGAVATEGSLIHQVTNDDFETGRIAGEHLLECGFQHFAYCGVTNAVWSEERKRGFISVAGSKVSNFEQSLRSWESPGLSGKLVQWIRKLNRPVGIMAANDTAGVKVTTACAESDIIVPHEAAVVGVDDEDILCELSSMPLTSIPCNCEQIGYEAARILNGIIKGGRKKAEHLRVSPLPLVVRASSDTVACEDERIREVLRYIRQNAGSPINVSDVISNVHMSRRSLEIKFRKALGYTIHEEIHRTRIRRACRLLGETDMPVAQIALASGFSSHQRFFEAFKTRMGISPREYRTSRSIPGR